MAIYNKRVKFTKETLLDHYLTRNSLFDYIYAIFRLIGIIVQNIYCVSSYLILSWIVLLPLSWIRCELYSRAENYLYNSLLFIVSSWSLAAGATIIETGDEYKQLIEEPNNHIIETKMITTNNVTTVNNNYTKNIINKQLSALNANGIQHTNHNSIKHDTGEKKSKTCDLVSKLRDETDRINTDNLNKQNNKTPISCGDQTKSEQTENDLISNEVDSQGKTNSDTRFNQDTNNSNFVKKPDSNENTDSKLLKLNSDMQTITSKLDQPHRLSIETRNNQKVPKVLLLCNHISTADVPLMMQSFSTLTNQSILWVLDAQFKPTNFGLVCSSHGDFFIAKDSFKDGSLRDQALRHPERNLLVLFPEGGFWRKRLEGSNRYALKNGLPMTRYVTHPRFGAFKDLIDPSVGVTHIVDATLFYDDIRNPLSILDIAFGNRKEPAILNYKVYNRSEINPTEEWLRNIWLEKDKLLQQYYEDRSCIYKRFEDTMRAAKLDWFRLLSVHLFYLSVCYLTIYRLFNATSVTMLKARDLYYSNI